MWIRWFAVGRGEWRADDSINRAKIFEVSGDVTDEQHWGL